MRFTILHRMDFSENRGVIARVEVEADGVAHDGDMILLYRLGVWARRNVAAFHEANLLCVYPSEGNPPPAVGLFRK